MHGDLRGIKETLLSCKKVASAIAYISSVPDVFIRWGEWDEGAFGVVHVEDELEESLDRFWRSRLRVNDPNSLKIGLSRQMHVK
jgi:hypothetical protein